MAERRMFAKTIIDSDMFLDMPLSTQALYFHLAMRADDEGFVNNPKRILRLINADEDSLKLLIAKQFIIPFESGIVVIRHWRIHNYIQSDRKKATAYTAEKALLKQDESGVYNMDTECIQNGYNLYTQDSIGEDRLIEVSTEKDINARARETFDKPKKEKFIPPTVEEVEAYYQETGKPIDAEAFVNYYTANGWRVGRNPMKSWQAAVANWRKNDEQRGTIYKPKRHDLDEIFPS